MPPRPELLEAVAGRYRLGRELGDGAMATVYLAEELPSGRRVAIKVLHRDLTELLGSGRFHREIEILQRLDHAGIVPVLDAQESGAARYFVMPYIAGESLESRLAREGPLSLGDCLGIADQVAEALDYAHAHNVLHRDIKPANILLDQTPRARVCDFGIARAIEAAAGDTISSGGLIFGTPAYMSPEQAIGAPVDGRTDVYALGCVVYEILAGEQLFSGPTSQAVIAKVLHEPPRSLRVVRPGVPRRVEDAVRDAVGKRPEQRPPTAGALMERLRG